MQKDERAGFRSAWRKADLAHHQDETRGFAESTIGKSIDEATFDPNAIQGAHRRTDIDFDRTVLSNWRKEGRKLINRNWLELNILLRDIRASLDRGRYAEAAARAQVAATYAVIWHPGIFVSAPLEACLREIGEGALPNAGRLPPSSKHAPFRILHVATQVGAIGGHVRMMWRWIQEDVGNVHSVALTRQFDRVPAALTSAVSRAHGAIHLLNHTPGSYLKWAQRLQARMREADLVVLHAHNHDVIPFIALAGMKHRPAVILVNHADHLFWLGAEFTDVVVNTRRSGRDLCAARRCIPRERNLTLPLCLQKFDRSQGRAAAKRALGFDPKAVIMLSIARGLKYRQVGPKTFADLLLPALQADPFLRLIVIGPGEDVDWTEACRAVPKQITVLPETPHTKPYLEAAEIYVDSFPFPSNTSLFEAGLHGLPLVSYYPFGPGCEVMGADSLGFDSTIMRARNATELNAILLRLAADPDLRIRIGDRTKQEIENTNLDGPWRAALAAIYERTFSTPGRMPDMPADVAPSLADVDVFHPFVFGGDSASFSSFEDRVAFITETESRALPFSRRLRIWILFLRRRGVGPRHFVNSMRCLPPEWLSRKIRGGIRHLGNS